MHHPDRTATHHPLLALLGLILSLACGAAHAQADASISDARIRLLPGTVPLAGYFNLRNTGDHGLRLVAASSPDFARVHMHRSMEHGGMSRMEAVEHLDIAPGQTLAFAPGGYHLMLMKRQRALQVGDLVPVVLQFADGTRMTVAFKVQPAGSR